NFLFDYFSLLVTRRFIRMMAFRQTVLWIAIILVADFVCSLAFALAGYMVMGIAVAVFINSFALGFLMDTIVAYGFAVAIASLLTSIWLWLYVSAGFILRLFRRFDIGFSWFNRRVDIENKPLQAIGLLAGIMCAVISLTFSFFGR